MMLSKDSIGVVTEYLEKSLVTKTVIGDAQTFGEITVIPVSDITFGFGGGGGEGVAKENNGNGFGSGAGARLAAKAVIVIKKGDVSVLPLTRGSAVEKILEAVPGLVEKLSQIPLKRKEEQPAEKPVEKVVEK